MSFIKNLRINKPTVIVDLKKVQKNIKKIISKAKAANINLRPHFKTHQSAEIAQKFKQENIHKATVSSISMAKYFHNNGWDDITAAVPFNRGELPETLELLETCKLGLLTDSIDTTEFMIDRLPESTAVWIKFDCGYNRVGLPLEKKETLLEIAQLLQKSQLKFEGILTHAGHTYNAVSISEIKEISTRALENTWQIKQYLTDNGFENFEVSYGDTPSCSTMTDFPGISELRPGNFVFYDLTQAKIGSCETSEIAVASACPVIGKYDDNRVAFYGGSVHLSKDSLMLNEKKTFGQLAIPKDDHWIIPGQQYQVRSLCQEVGSITLPQEYFEQVKIGEPILILPPHSCLTADLQKHYLSIDDKIIPRFSL